MSQALQQKAKHFQGFPTARSKHQPIAGIIRIHPVECGTWTRRFLCDQAGDLRRADRDGQDARLVVISTLNAVFAEVERGEVESASESAPTAAALRKS